MTAYEDALIERANAHWDELLRQNPPDLVEYADWQRTHHLMGDGPVCKTLRPNFVTHGQFAADCVASESVFAALCLAGDWVASQPHLRRRYLGQIWEEFADWLTLDVGHDRRCLNCNFDAYVTPQGLQFLELNCVPSGRELMDLCSQLFSRLDLFQQFQQHYTLRPLLLCPDRMDAFMAAYREWGGQGLPTAVSLRGPQEKTSQFVMSTQAAITAEWAKLGVAMHWAQPGDLSFDGKRLLVRDIPVDLIGRPSWKKIRSMGAAAAGALLSAVRAHAACLPNPCDIYDHKALFAVVTDPECDLDLPRHLRQAVQEHVPWTRVVRDERTQNGQGESIELLRWAGENRHQLVLKPTDSYGGDGVVLGWEVDLQTWTAALTQAAATPASHIVQARVPTRKTTWPLLAAGIPDVQWTPDRCPFLVAGRMAGYRTRLSRTSLNSASQVGSIAPTFVVAERA